jgi:hypothetical protein
MPVEFCNPSYLLHFHFTFSEKPEHRRKKESLLYLHLPHHCYHLIFCSMYLHIYSPSNHISNGQDGGRVLYYWDTLAQPSDLYSEEYRSEKCHEKINCGVGICDFSWQILCENSNVYCLYNLAFATWIREVRFPGNTQ